MKQASRADRHNLLNTVLAFVTVMCIAATPSLQAQTCDAWKSVVGWQGTYTLTSNGEVMHGSTNRFFINETSGATVAMLNQIDGLCDQLGWSGADAQNTGSVTDSTQILNGCQQGQWFTNDTLNGDAGYPSSSELYINATGGTFSFQPIPHDWVTHTIYNCQSQQSQVIEWATAPGDNWPQSFLLPQQVGPLVVNNYHFSAASRYAGYQDIDWTISFDLTPILPGQNALTVTVQDSGTVTSTDGFINCPGSCTHSYSSGAQVTLDATPGAGNTFITWSGACSGTGPCTVTLSQPQTVNAVFSPPLQFVVVPPCRVIDTRSPNGQFGGPPLQGGTQRSFTIPQGNCNIPATAAAYSLNVTVAPGAPLGYFTVWPTGENQPAVSTMNSPDGRTKANAAIVPAGTTGAISFYVTNNTNLIVDIDGYFQPAGASTSQFYSLAPCRLVDTRNPNGDLGGPYLAGGAERDFPLLESLCINNLPLQPLAYSLNFTAVPHPHGQRLRYLTVWPTGGTQPVVSTLNNPTATTVANAAIVPAGTGGGIQRMRQTIPTCLSTSTAISLRRAATAFRCIRPRPVEYLILGPITASPSWVR